AQATAAVRDPARARDLLAAAGRLAVGLTLTDFGDPEVTAPDVLISTVPVGAADFHAERITRGTLAPGHLLDVVYHPWPTPLAVAARRAGIGVAGGFPLPLHHAPRQVTLITGKPPPPAALPTAGPSPPAPQPPPSP